MADHDEGGDGADGGPALARRPVELAVAGLLGALAVLVMADSWRVGVGWGLEGPQAGFFPFYVGLVLLGSAGTTLAGALLRPGIRRDGGVPAFADRRSLGRVVAVLAPTIVFVVAVNWLGLYVAAAVLIAFFMRVYGSFPLAYSAAIGVAVAAAVFLAFEIWFLMPLPKGPLEAALGY